MSRIPVFVAVVAMAACRPLPLGPPASLPEGAPPVQHGRHDEALIAAVDAEVQAFLEAFPQPGLAVALFAPGEVLYTGAYGWSGLLPPRPLTLDTPIRLSSVSKTLIGVAAMQAEAAGNVGLDTPLEALVDFDVSNPHHPGTITLRHALTHTTGIEDTHAYDASYAPGDPTEPLGTFLEGYLRPDGAHWRSGNFASRAPGAAFSYSNVGAALAAHALAQAADRPFDVLVRETVLTPLGMADTAYFFEDVPKAPATLHAPAVGRRFRAWAPYGYPTYPDGMLHSTAPDLARFGAMVLGGGTLDGVDVLTPALVDTMLTVDPAIGTDEDGQALVWARRMLDGRALMGHNGGDFGSFADLWMDREAGVGFALLTTLEPSHRMDLIGLLALEAALLRVAEAAVGR